MLCLWCWSKAFMVSSQGGRYLEGYTLDAVVAKNSIGHKERIIHAERRRAERPAEWTPAPHLMRSGAWDTPVLTSENPRGTGLTPSGERLLFCPRTSLHAVCRSYR